MNISERLTQKRLLEILTEAYVKGQEDSIKVDDFVAEMKRKVIAVVETNNKGDFEVKELCELNLPQKITG
jgi:replicative DNA helicase